MPPTRHARPSRKTEEEDTTRRPAPDEDDTLAEQSWGSGTPALPDLSAGPLEPEAWLALQQTIGNSAVGGLVERRRAGQPLPADTRHDMEASFVRNFGQVQIHSGPEVDRAAQALQAAAFTVGDDIYLHSDLPNFEDPFGREVLGEELAHVAQGVGQDGVGRLTAPGETAEREARTAGLAAAAGEHAHVSAVPEMEGAVARFDPFGLFGPSAPAVEGVAAEKTDLSDEEKDRLSAGALAPLSALFTQLGNQQAAAPGGQPSATALTAIAQNAGGIPDFILSFTGPPAVQPRIESAAQSVLDGYEALIGALDPVQMTKGSGDNLSQAAGEISALASPPLPANTPAPANAPPPPAAPAATPAAPAPADALTPAEVDQIKYGAVEPLKSAGQQLQGEQPDLDAILALLAGVPNVLRSFTKPAALVPQLRRNAMEVEGQVTRLVAVAAGPQGAIGMAMSEWQKAIGQLQSLTAKSPGGGPPTKPETPASGDDEDWELMGT